MYFDTQKETVQAAVKMTPDRAPEEVTMIRIRDTLSMGEIEVSENLLSAISARSDMEILSEPMEMPFNNQGDLFA